MNGAHFVLSEFHGRKAMVLDNGTIRVSALSGGGHIAEVRFVNGGADRTVNPMRVPHYPTIEPQKYDPAKHDAIYGDDPHRWISSGYMGHMLCFPAFGPPSSEEEIRNAFGNHGEAPIVEWKKTGVYESEDSVTLRYAAELPKTQYRVERSITIVNGESVVYVEESVENLAEFDRAMNWVQHATFGPPFAEPGKTFLDASVGKGKVAGGQGSLKANSTVEWPKGTSVDGKEINLRGFQKKAHAGSYAALLHDRDRAESYFTMYHSDFPVLIGYLYPTKDSPWLGDWQENHNMTHKPWNGEVIARGMEFGTTPFAEGLKKSVDRGSLYGVAAFRWIGGKQKLTTHFTIFLAEVEKDFKGVRDVRAEAGKIVVSRRDGKKLSLDASRAQ
jgi:hypothetical protein